MRTLFCLLFFTTSAFNAYANDTVETHPWQSPAPTLLNAMKTADRWVAIHQGWNVYAGILACYESSSDGAFCLINPLESNVLDPEIVSSLNGVYGTSILNSLLDESSSLVGKAFGEGIEASFLVARCYEPVGTADLNDQPYCQTSTHYEETN